MATGEDRQFRALSKAVYEQDRIAVEKLVKKVRADAMPYNALGESVLMSAVRNGAGLDIIKLLVEQGGASLDWKTNSGETPITHAVQADRADVIEYFASRGANVRHTPFAELAQADKDARLHRALNDWTDDQLADKVAQMVKDGADPNAKIDGLTAMLRLAHQGANVPATYEVLLASGADPTLTDAEGDTVLHVEAKYASHVPILRLLAAAVPLDIRDRQGRTPLHRAAIPYYWDAAKYVGVMLKLGFDPELRDAAGKRPIDLAEGDVKKLLIKQTMKPISQQSHDLLTAIAADKLAAVDRLLGAGADPCAIDTSGKDWGRSSVDGVAAVHLVFTRDVSRAVQDRVLAQAKIDVNVRSADGRVPLHYALQYGQGSDRIELVKRLLALGADPNIANDRGEPPIFELTSMYDHADTLELFALLVAAGAKPDHANSADETMLDEMFEKTQRFNEQHDKRGFVQVMSHLVEAGVPSKSLAQVKAWLAKKLEKAKPKPKSKAK